MPLSKIMSSDLPEGMSLPDSFIKLFQWMKDNSFILHFEGNDYRGFLNAPKADLHTEDEEGNNIVLGGTDIAFWPQDKTDREYNKDTYGALSDRLYIFASTGGDGSSAAFWLDDDGNQKIVHIGSGSGSTLFCIITDDPIQFIKLIAIGYDEICWLQSKEENTRPPNLTDKDESLIYPNEKFQEWVKSTFETEIPQTASEIIPDPSCMEDETSTDAFWQWHRKNSKGF